MRFVPNPGFDKALERTPQYLALLKGMAEAGAANGKRLAKAEAFDTGAYANSFRGEVGTSPTGLIGRINVYDRKAGLLEFHGTQNGRGRAILRRSAEPLTTRFIQGGRS